MKEGEEEGKEDEKEDTKVQDVEEKGGAGGREATEEGLEVEMKVVKEEEQEKAAVRRGSGWWDAGWGG